MLCVQFFFVYLFPFGCFSSLCFVCVCKKMIAELIGFGWNRNMHALDGSKRIDHMKRANNSVLFCSKCLKYPCHWMCFRSEIFRSVECQNAVYPLQNSLFTNRFSGSDFYGIVNCYEWAFDQMKVTIKLSAAFILMALIQLHSNGISRQWFLNSIPLYSK